MKKILSMLFVCGASGFAFWGALQSAAVNNGEILISKSTITFVSFDPSAEGLLCPEGKLVNFDKLRQLCDHVVEQTGRPPKYSYVRVAEGYARLDGGNYRLLPPTHVAIRDYYLVIHGPHQPRIAKI